MSMSTGLRNRVETGIRAVMDAQIRRALSAVYPETSPEEEAGLERLRDFICIEAVPEVANEVYKMLGVPTNTRRILVRIEGNGLQFKGGNIEAKITTGDSEENILDLRALRDQWVELHSTQTEIPADIISGNEQMEIEPEPEPEKEPEPSIEQKAETEQSDESAFLAEGETLFHVIDPEGNARTTVPILEEDARALMTLHIEECGGSEADGWKIVPATNDFMPEPESETETEPEPEPETETEPEPEPEPEPGDVVLGDDLIDPPHGDPEPDPEPSDDSGQSEIPLEETPKVEVGGLSQKQKTAAEVLRGGGSVKAAADAADVSVDTVKRWCKNLPEFESASMPTV